MASENIIQDIRQLFIEFGEKSYGEKCSQITHAISCASHATEKSAPSSMIVAAFLHDIGHFLADKNKTPGLDELGHIDHASIGANWLSARGFDEAVTEPIRLHVEAKRYRARENDNNLSAASLQTLAQQGGPMSQQESERFEQNPFFEDAILLRELDDLGKPGEPIKLDIDYWMKKIETAIG